MFEQFRRTPVQYQAVAALEKFSRGDAAKRGDRELKTMRRNSVANLTRCQTNKTTRHSALSLLLVMLSLPALAQVYIIRDENGEVTYTDTPPQNEPHEKLELEALNTQPPVTPKPRTAPTEERDEQPVNYRITLRAPSDGVQVPPGQRNLSLAVQVSPALGDDYAIQYFMDGNPLGPPTRATTWTIEEIYRGEHRLSARVVNRQGRVVAETEAVTAFVHRPSIHHPSRN